MVEPNLSDQLLKDLKRLQRTIDEWTSEGLKRLERAYKRIALAWRAGAERRVPVDESLVAQHILSNTYWDEGEKMILTTEVGTNVKDYPVYIEFGTELIAGGRVLALGEDPDISDSQAVRFWPAKNQDRISEKTGEEFAGARKARLRREKTGTPDEQMPWLRPSFVEIRDWAIEEIDDALEPPQ